MKKKTVVLSILFWSVLSHANLIPNSGFEEGLPRMAWKAPVEISAKNAHSGRQSLQMTGTDEKKMIHAKWSRSVPVKPNTVYTFSAWIRTENADARVGLFLHDENDQYIGHNNIWPPSVSGTCDWTKTTIVFNSGKAHYTVPVAGIRSSEGKAWFDAFELLEGNHAKGENLLRNTSFRTCTTPGYPDFWGIGPQCPMSVKDWETGNYYGIAKNEKSPVEGTSVLFLKAPAASSLFVMTLKPAPNVPMTFSLYLKATVDQFKVHLAGTNLLADRKWRRYQVPVIHRSSRSFWPSIHSRNSSGILYLAAPQLEYGTSASAWKESTPDDKTGKHVEPKRDRLPSARISGASVPPVLNGCLTDAVWKNAWKTEDFTDHITGEKGPLTRGWFSCDKDYLYFAFECTGKASVIPETEKGWSRFSGDSVEIFLQPGNGTTCHLVLNPLGELHLESGTDGRMGRWNSEIKYAVSRNGNNWTGELAIPLNSLQPLKENDWKFNLCRNFRMVNGKTLHLTAGGRNSYHSAEHFIRIAQLPIKPEMYEFTAPGLIGNSFFTLLRMEILNPRKYTVELRFGNQKRSLPLLPSGKEIPVIFDQMPALSPETEIEIVLLSEDKRELTLMKRKVLHLTAKTPESPLQLFSQYNWYGKEESPLRFRVASKRPGKQKIRIFHAGNMIREISMTGPQQQDFELSAKGLRDGMMFRAELFAENELKARASESIRILPQPAGKTTRVNRFLRVLERDGKPFLPVLFHPVPIRATPEWIYSRLKQDHYNSIELILPPEMGRDTKFSDIGLILKQAAKHKFPALVRLNTRCTASGKQNEFRNFADFLNVRKKILELCAPHENVLAFYLMDEPGPEHWEGNLKFKESDLGKMTKAAREIAPYHPLTINYNSYVTGKPIYGGFSSFDFLYYDSYPFLDSGTPRRNPCEFFAADAKRLNDSAASFGMPVFFWIATYGYGDASRMPTPDEYQNQVYTALIYGTRGIEYFTDYPVSVPLIQRVRAVHKKIAAFSPVLLDPETECESRNQEFLHYAILKRHGKTYVLAANTSSEKTGTLHIDGAAPLVLKPVQSDFYELKNGVLQSF